MGTKSTKIAEKILLVDDDSNHLSLVVRFISSIGCSYMVARDGLEAIEQLKNNTFNVVVTDLMMPKVDGMQLLQFVKEQYADTDVIVMTGYSKNYAYTDVIKAGATDFIEKPFKKDEFIAKLNRLFRERKLLQDLRSEVVAHQKTVRELELAKREAESANEAKTEFLNTISHEFRTPMNGIVGFASILSKTELSREQRKYLDIVNDSSQRLMSLINHLLDFISIEVIKKDVSDIKLYLDTTIAELLAFFEAKAKKKGVNLIYSIDATVPQELYGDVDILSQILNNLTDNAIKFSLDGTVSVNVKVGRRSNDISDKWLLLHFSIKDNGQGIAEEQQKRIFEPFNQSEQYMSRGHEGAGLGLAICAKLVAVLGGEIWVESEVGKGSVFHFTSKFSVQ